MEIIMKINESLQAKDLKDLVLPIISVDEYESRVSNDAIVIGFMVHDKDAAIDLNSFIQKSAIKLLDVDISPSPDQHGFYYVFVEFLNNNLLAVSVDNLIKDISPLVDIKNWKMRIRKTRQLIPFSKEELIAGIKRAERINEKAIYNFFKKSDLLGLQIDGNKLTMNETISYEICDFVPLPQLIEESENKYCINSTFSDVANSSNLSRLLGEGWDVDVERNNVIIHSHLSDMAIILKKII